MSQPVAMPLNPANVPVDNNTMAAAFRDAIERFEQKKATEEVAQAHGYLVRNVLQVLHPDIVPFGNLMGVCAQVDHLTATILKCLKHIAEQKTTDELWLEEMSSMEEAEPDYDLAYDAIIKEARKAIRDAAL